MDNLEISVDEIEALVTEDVADAIHQTWMEEKAKAGYEYGEIRNDDPTKGKLTHPDMIPYAKLTYQKQDWDRQTGKTAVNRVFKALEANGFKIVRA